MHLKLNPRSVQKNVSENNAPPLKIIPLQCTRAHWPSQQRSAYANKCKAYIAYVHTNAFTHVLAHFARVLMRARIRAYELSVSFRSPLPQFPTCSKDKGWTTSFPVMPQLCAVNNCITTNGTLTETHGFCKTGTTLLEGCMRN